MKMFNGVFDISHFQGDVDFEAANAAGFDAVICKATQGIDFTDPMCATNLDAAASAGLLYGVYHFGTAGDGVAQASYFLEKANPDMNAVVVLDFESNGSNSMSIKEAQEFVTEINNQMGMYPLLYAGGYLKDLLKGKADPVLSQCPLWLASYTTVPLVPRGWKTWTLWQYTDKGHVPGVAKPCDRSYFNGTQDQLQAMWPFADPDLLPGAIIA